MNSPLTWTVGRRLAAIAGIGVLTSLVVGGAAVRGAADVKSHSDSVQNIQEARSLLHALDTRASELKVDGLKALVLKDPRPIRNDVQDDVATPNALLAELEKLQLDAHNTHQVAEIDKAYKQY